MGKIHINKLNYSKFRDGFRPTRAVIFLSERRSCNALVMGAPRRRRCLPRAAEKLGELGDPGLQWTRFGKQSLGLLVVPAPPQRRQHVGERRFFLLRIPRTEGEPKR